jgi:hypothetical protein
MKDDLFQYIPTNMILRANLTKKEIKSQISNYIKELSELRIYLEKIYKKAQTAYERLETILSPSKLKHVEHNYAYTYLAWSAIDYALKDIEKIKFKTYDDFVENRANLMKLLKRYLTEDPSIIFDSSAKDSLQWAIRNLYYKELRELHRIDDD